MCRKPKLIQEISTADNEKADLQISSLEGGNVPIADSGNLKLSGNLRLI